MINLFRYGNEKSGEIYPISLLILIGCIIIQLTGELEAPISFWISVVGAISCSVMLFAIASRILVENEKEKPNI